MLQNPCKTLGFKKNLVYKTPPGGQVRPYPASGLLGPTQQFNHLYGQISFLLYGLNDTLWC